MPSQDKLIKQGIKYTDKLFDEITKRLEKGVKASDSLEAFLDKYHKAFPDKGNPLISLGYDKTMIDLILSETNNHRFSRPAQKELVRVTVEEKVGELIRDVGEDIKDSVRDIVRDGYNRNLSQDEIALNISNRVSAIKCKRARAIARTEIARTATVSDYVINRERGANGWYVECRNTACPVCKDRWHKSWTPENDDSFTPSDTSAGGKGWIGDRIFSMNDTGSLPPVHPNCYDSETKVFTDNGWKYFKDITETDKILSLNPQTNETEFLEPVKLIQVPNVHGKLYHIHNKWFDVCVTPDHDCFVHKRKDGGKKGRYFEPQFRKPSELNSECHFVRCIDTDRESPEAININGLEFEPSDFAFFMAWYISEGSVLHNPETAKAHGYPVKITQEIVSNRDVIEPRLKAICDKLGYRLAIGKSYYEIYSKPLYDYLVELGYSYEKYIPKEVFTLDKGCLNIFLDNYVLGDGHERIRNNDLVQNSSERILYTSSKRLRDDLSYLILLCGFYPSISVHTKKGTVSKHKNGEYVQKNDVYQISINKSQYTTFSSCTVDKIPYDDFVYCVELPKWHTLWVMRNGKTSWNGNCRCVVYYTSEEPNVSTEPVQQTTTTTATTTKPKTDEPKNILDNLTDDELKKYNKSQQIIEKNTKALEKLSSDDPRRIMFESRIKSAKRTIKKLEEIASNSNNRKVVEEILLQKGGKKNNNLDYAKINSNEELASYFGFTYIEERTSQYGKTSSRPIFRDEKHNVDITGMEMFDILETKEVLESYDKSHPFLKRATTSLHLDPSTDIRELGVCYTSSNSITIYSHKRDLDSNSIQSTVDHEMSHAFDNILGSEFDKYHSQESKEYRKIVREEGWSSLYSYSTKGSTRIAEDIAEAGSMVLNKKDPNVRIKMPDGEIITAKEWCKRFPKKTAYFEKLLESKEAKKLLGE